MSRQDIINDPVRAYPQLEQFLGAYFHQDWGKERDGWEAVVDDFVADSPGSVVTSAAEEGRDLLTAGFSDAELADVLDGLGGSVVPTAFGLTPSAWLAAVLERLIQSR